MSDWTGTGTIAVTGGTGIWTPTTLGAQLRGEINQDADAAGGAVPDRLVDDVQAAYRDLWDLHTWRFRRRRSTLTVDAAGTYAELPSNFEQFDLRWLQDSADDAGRLTITEDWELFEAHREAHDDDSGGVPELACVEPASDPSSGFSEILRVSPPAGKEYIFDIIYFCTAPDLDDTASPLWPKPYYSAWEFGARARVYHTYRADKNAWKGPYNHFESLVERLKLKNDPTTRTRTPRIRDTVRDIDALASSAWLRGGMPTVWR